MFQHCTESSMKLGPLQMGKEISQSITYYFDQDNAPAHTADNPMQAVWTAFNERIISRGLWSSHSLDLNMCDFYLWGNLHLLCWCEVIFLNVGGPTFSSYCNQVS
jgi:hypothetical protein